MAKWKYVEIKKKKQIGNQEGNVIVKQKLAEPKKIYWNLCPNRFTYATRPKVLKDVFDSIIPIVELPKKVSGGNEIEPWLKKNSMGGIEYFDL